MPVMQEQGGETIPKVSAIANWFGSARMVADRIGPELDGCPLVVVPFMGGASELPYIRAGKLLVNDKHRQVVNLAEVMAHPTLGPKLFRRLKREVFHPDTLARAQERCRRVEACDNDADSLFASGFADPRFERPDLDRAADYFIATWMGRGGNSGTRGEFSGSLPIRYSPNGGGSAQRYHNAVASIVAWKRVLRRCEFTTDDAFDVLAKCHDSPKTGIYCDSPWPDAGDGYAHPFTESHQRRLAKSLARFTVARVVVRYADHPLIRELYPRDRWNWITYPSRTQHNGEFDEVLLINGPSLFSELPRSA